MQETEESKEKPKEKLEEKSKRKMSEEHKKKIAEAMKRRHAEGKYDHLKMNNSVESLTKNRPVVTIGKEGIEATFQEAKLDEETSEFIEERTKPIKVYESGYFTYDVLFRDIGHRILVMPAPFQEVFEGFITDTFFTEDAYTVKIRVADTWLVRIAYTYHPVEMKKVGVYVVFCSLWHVKHGLFPHDSALHITPEAFEEMAKKIQSYFSLEISQQLIDEKKQKVGYQKQLKTERDAYLVAQQDYAGNIMRVGGAGLKSVIDAIERLRKGEEPSRLDKLKAFGPWKTVGLFALAAGIIATIVILIAHFT